MKLKYIGKDKFRIKTSKMIHVENGVEVDFTEEQAKEFSKRETDGKKDWTEAKTETPKEKKKGDK